MPQTICLNMIVKNEEAVIRRALDSACKYVDKIVVEDTGSTDNTVEIIASYPNAEVIQHPWQDFAYNRNHAFDWARSSKCDYVLFLDADDVLDFPPDFEWPQLTHAGYDLPVHYGVTRYGRCALVKSNAPWFWEGVVHEYLNSKVPLRRGSLEWPHIKIIGGGARSQNPEKFKRDAEVLEQALEKEPENPRYMFYLAQSYRDAGMPANALAKYSRRVELGGFPEEAWFSQYQIGVLMERDNQDPTMAYLKAYQMRPTRAEPLYQLARYHRCKKNYDIAYTFAARGFSMSMPADVLFVDTSVYEYGLKEEKALSSYYVGKKDEGKVILEMLVFEGKGNTEHYKEQLRWFV